MQRQAHRPGFRVGFFSRMNSQSFKIVHSFSYLV
jgi:hypothetical protein